jgi:multidrug efflux system membrane fusion protein
VAHPVEQPVQDSLDYTGRIESSQRVEVRSRVSGYVAAIRFRDGQLVKAGDPLYVIDQRPFVTARDRSRANLAQAQARHKLAAAQLDRVGRLHETGSASTEELDQARGEFEGTQAAVLMNQAELRNAELDLAYTTVTAPIAGKVSDHRVDIGNYVAGGTTAGGVLTTIVALDPVRATVDLSEADFRRLSRLPRFPEQVRVVMDGEGAAVAQPARVDFIDNEASVLSGTVRLRASLANADHALVPGYFARVQIPLGAPQPRLTVPDAAVQSDQARKLVLLVNSEDQVAPRVVQLGPLSGDRRVVLSGLAAGDRVIVGGAQRVRPGDRVKAVAAAAAEVHSGT